MQEHFLNKSCIKLHDYGVYLTLRYRLERLGKNKGFIENRTMSRKPHELFPLEKQILLFVFKC